MSGVGPANGTPCGKGKVYKSFMIIGKSKNNFEYFSIFDMLVVSKWKVCD